MSNLPQPFIDNLHRIRDTAVANMIPNLLLRGEQNFPLVHAYIKKQTVQLTSEGGSFIGPDQGKILLGLSVTCTIDEKTIGDQTFRMHHLSVSEPQKRNETPARELVEQIMTELGFRTPYDRANLMEITGKDGEVSLHVNALFDYPNVLIERQTTTKKSN